MVDEKVTVGVERGERKTSCRCGERWREKEVRGGKILNFSKKKIQKKKDFRDFIPSRSEKG